MRFLLQLGKRRKLFGALPLFELFLLAAIEGKIGDHEEDGDG
jgi:hypothetical protein